MLHMLLRRRPPDTCSFHDHGGLDRVRRLTAVLACLIRRSSTLVVAGSLLHVGLGSSGAQQAETSLIAAQAPRRDDGVDRRSRRGRAVGDEFRTQTPRRPYDIVLGNPTGDSVTASILAYSPIEGYFEYGLRPSAYSSRSDLVRLESGRPAEVLLGGLAQNAQYFYRWVTTAGPADTVQPSDEFHFRTGRAPGDVFVFTVQADSHLDGRTNTRLYEASLRNAMAAKPDFHVDLGDTFMTDKRSDYRDALPQYLAQRYYFGLIGAVAPVFLVSGNHDGEDARRHVMRSWAREQRDAYFATPSDGARERGNYYAWDWGDALFVTLDPFWETGRSRNREDYWNRTLGEDQFRWLAETLRSSNAKFKFVFIHHLVGGVNQPARGGIDAARLFEWGGRGLDGTYQFDERRPGWGQPIHQLLVETGVTIVFHGHDHMFAREDLDGVVYLLVPQPGLDRDGPPRDVAIHYTSGEVVGGPGHVRVTVSPETALVELVQSRIAGRADQNGRTAYSFRARPR